jgi:hypothetical protein
LPLSAPGRPEEKQLYSSGRPGYLPVPEELVPLHLRTDREAIFEPRWGLRGVRPFEGVVREREFAKDTVVGLGWGQLRATGAVLLIRGFRRN